jgi:hypothetical protein
MSSCEFEGRIHLENPPPERERDKISDQGAWKRVRTTSGDNKTRRQLARLIVRLPTVGPDFRDNLRELGGGTVVTSSLNTKQPVSTEPEGRERRERYNSGERGDERDVETRSKVQVS